MVHGHAKECSIDMSSHNNIELAAKVDGKLHLLLSAIATQMCRCLFRDAAKMQHNHNLAASQEVLNTDRC